MPANSSSIGPDLMLGPATRMLWRTAGCVHLELGSQAVVVEGLSIPVIRQVAASTSPLERFRYPDVQPTPSESHALTALRDAGYLWPRIARVARADERASGTGGTGGTGGPLALLKPPAPRLAGELAALAGRRGPQAADVLAARSRASVGICGSSRIAIQLATILAAAGVGRVHCDLDGTVRLRHLAPGGPTLRDEGEQLGAVVDLAIRNAGTEVDTTPLPSDERPDLTVLAADAPITDERRRALHARDAPYLALSTGVNSGIIGPLVLPGLTSCLRCADLHRADRDPAWSALAVQLAVPTRYGPASEVAVTAMIAGAAAIQVLAFLDGEEPAVVDATLELHLPDWRLRRRSWPPHPDCDCSGWAQ